MRRTLLFIGISIILNVSGFLFNSSKLTMAEKASTTPVNSYEYIARPGDSLSLLTRKSLQLYAGAKNIQLSPATIMYCENSVVTMLGSRHLEINEHVAIAFDLLQQYIVNSRGLNASQLAAWNNYAQYANFNLSDLHPINESNAQSTAQPKTSSTSTDSNIIKQTDTKTENNISLPVQPKVNFSWPHWFLTLSTTVIVAYAFKKFNP